MKGREHPIHGRLCELLDKQLTADQQDEVLHAMKRDPSLRQRLHDYRRIRELVRAAFAIPPAAPRRSGSKWYRSLAAGVLLTLGFAAGWTSHVHASGIRTTEFAIADPSAFRTLAQPISAHPNNLHALLHVSSANPADMEAALDEAQSLLASYRQEHKKLELEILANAGGLNLFRADQSHFRQRIAELQRQYRNIRFLACGRTLERLRMQKRIDPKLLPGVHVVPSALSQILLRLNEGWVYVKA